jgi:predicted SAM-dependent methyltransferase
MIAAEYLDRIDGYLCRLGIVRPVDWKIVRSGKITKHYAGGLYRTSPQFKSHVGISPYERSSRTIWHDLLYPLPIADGSVDIFQSEDVFEHIPYVDLNSIIDEIFRVLKPGELFRLSVPDYRCPVLYDRTLRSETGEFLFDPGGGGALISGNVTGGGHVWFPVYESVKSLLDNSRFARDGCIKFLHYTEENGRSVLHNIDYSSGHVQRTPDHDDRVKSPRCAMSIVVDAIKRETACANNSTQLSGTLI